jgi:hypothetical protein
MALFLYVVNPKSYMRPINYFLFFAIALLFFSCASPSKYVKQGNYNAAIYSATKKLRKSGGKGDKHIVALETAFNAEKRNMLNRIEQLQLEGQPSSWVTIHGLYSRLDGYQNAISPLLPLFIQRDFRNADIKLININNELNETKLKASEYLYASGERLLAENNKMAARQAYAKFRQVKDFYTDFKDVDAKINEAYNKGQNHILIQYFNQTQMVIPQDFFNNLMLYDERLLNSQWTKFTKVKDDNMTYDYLIDVVLNVIDIGPDQIRENTYTDTKLVQDGMKYVLDDRGNVKKDEEGNDVREPNMVNVMANVTMVDQTKVGTLTGTVMYKHGNGQAYRNFPFREDLVFKNQFATFQGNKDALSTESLKRVGGRFVPFPSNMQLVMDASEIIKNKSLNLIKANTNLVLN